MAGRQAGDPADSAGSPRAAQVAEARSIVLRQLGVRARSREQLRTRLLDRGIPDEVAIGVLDRFEEVGLVDDAAYAEMLVRTRREQRGLSRRALAREMRVHGIDDATAESALAGIGGEDEEAAALALATKKAAGTRTLTREVRERRIAAMLGRKGYSADVVAKVTRGVLEGD